MKGFLQTDDDERMQASSRLIGIGGYSGKPGLTGAVAEVSACTG